MKRVSYAGESFLTADSIADALVDLTAALGRTKKAEAVELPAIDGQGKPRSVRLVVGPASQLVAMQEDSLFREPDSEETVSLLRALIRTLAPRRAAVSTRDTAPVLDMDELDSL